MTKRFGWLLGALVVVAAAACGDDGNSPQGANECGDGVVLGVEGCDDGNKVNGDGCSSTCQIEAETAECGDATLSPPEACDDGNTTNGDGCSSTCQIEVPVTCGNGHLDADEMCDDGNQSANDGCTACTPDAGFTCAGSPSVCTMVITPAGTCAAPFNLTFTPDADGIPVTHAIGNTTTSTNQVAAGTCSGVANIGGGKDHTYKFVLLATSDVVISGPDDAAFNLAARLTTTACNVATEIKEFPGADGCDNGTAGDGMFMYFIGLPAGTYYLDVDGATTTDAGAYDVEIDAFPSFCGDGEQDLGEECDDMDNMNGDGCNARCEQETGSNCGFPASATTTSVCTLTCGDGVQDHAEQCDDDNTVNGDGCDDNCYVEAGYVCDVSDDPSVCVIACGDGAIDTDDEECDDGNTASGDGCNASCELEFDVSEAENNNTTPQILTPVNHRIDAALGANDIDLYTFTLTAPARIELETYTTIDAAATYLGYGDERLDCTGDTDTVLRIFSGSTTNGTALYADDDDGQINDSGDPLGCSYIGAGDSSFDGTGDVADPNQGVLAAGTYTIKVTSIGGVAVSRYLLSMRIITAPVAGSIAINEYMANDGSIDTNCDASTTEAADTADEYVELVNTSTSSLNLTGVTVSDAAGLKHTFAAGATGSMELRPKQSVVVWSGGAPSCPGVDNFFVASTGSLALNNTGTESIIVKSGATTIVSTTWASSTQGVSTNLSPDVTGTAYALHNVVTGHVGSYSPGKRNNGTLFAY